MVTRALVADQIDQGVQLLRLLDETGVPIEAAYWMLASEWSAWWLVLVTPRADETARIECPFKSTSSQERSTTSST